MRKIANTTAAATMNDFVFSCLRLCSLFSFFCNTSFTSTSSCSNLSRLAIVNNFVFNFFSITSTRCRESFRVSSKHCSSVMIVGDFFFDVVVDIPSVSAISARVICATLMDNFLRKYNDQMNGGRAIEVVQYIVLLISVKDMNSPHTRSINKCKYWSNLYENDFL
uniref:Glutathione S transferase Omega 3 n=1 Tax=Meteorus pulchricornis TaxID=51522 RepID=A0A6M3GVK5_9HYME|nr:glutathione S transferase Omega 3 [Meteorus pulchricornis]